MLKVRDELVGKRLKCPGCGNTFEAKAGGGGGGGGGGAAPAKGGTRIDPKKAKKPGEKGPKVAVSWGFIMMIIGALAIPAVVIMWIVGPGRVKRDWEGMFDKAHDSVTDVVTQGLKAHLSQNHDWNPNRPGNDPRVTEVMFIFDPFVMSMPESVPFKGESNQGEFSGKFHPKTGEVEAEVGIGAVTLIQGVPRPEKYQATQKIHVTGRGVGNGMTAEVNGKKAEIYYPPKTTED
jgi:hypothetical protein